MNSTLCSPMAAVPTVWIMVLRKKRSPPSNGVPRGVSQTVEWGTCCIASTLQQRTNHMQREMRSHLLESSDPHTRPPEKGPWFVRRQSSGLQRGLKFLLRGHPKPPSQTSVYTSCLLLTTFLWDALGFAIPVKLTNRDAVCYSNHIHSHSDSN